MLSACVHAGPVQGPTYGLDDLENPLALPAPSAAAQSGPADVEKRPDVSSGPQFLAEAPGSEAEARRRFSEAAYCPVRRVHVRLVDGAAPPPPSIARDTERLAMWRAASKQRVKDQMARVLRAEGCGERSDFACFEQLDFGPVCIERSGALLLDGVAPSAGNAFP